MLQTVESTNVEQIIIQPFAALEAPIAESVYREWQDLDRVLLHFWTSRSIRPRIGYRGESDLIELAPILLPELTSRGVVDLV